MSCAFVQNVMRKLFTFAHVHGKRVRYIDAIHLGGVLRDDLTREL